VEAALTMSPTQAKVQQESRKPTIGARKTQAKKGVGQRMGQKLQNCSLSFSWAERNWAADWARKK